MIHRKRGRPRKDIMLDITHKQEEAMRKAKHAAIAGGNPQLGHYPLGALWGRGLITQAMHDAGLKYAALYGRVFGRTTPGTSEGGSFDLSDAAMEKCEREWREAANLLSSHSRQIKDAVDNACVYQRYPRILFSDEDVRPRKADGHLIDGLAILDKLFNAGEARVA